MKIKYFLSASIFLVMLALQHCDKHELTELEKTTNGKGTFGCLVDGKAWVIESIPDAQAYYQTGTLSIVASLANKAFYQDISIGILNNPNLTIGEYILSDYPSKYGALDDNRLGCDYITASQYQYIGVFKIIFLDKTNFIISGTFAFDAHGTNCSKTVKITEGRFDIHYAP